MTVIAYTYPGTTSRVRWLFPDGDVSAVVKTLREVGMLHVAVEEDAQSAMEEDA